MIRLLLRIIAIRAISKQELRQIAKTSDLGREPVLAAKSIVSRAPRHGNGLKNRLIPGSDWEMIMAEREQRLR
jgi:hypothetical protein